MIDYILRLVFILMLQCIFIAAIYALGLWYGASMNILNIVSNALGILSAFLLCEALLPRR